MKRKVGKKRRGAKRHFLLPQILPMRPYLLSLMADLRECYVRQQRLRAIVNAPKPTAEVYQERRKRYDAVEEMNRAQDQQQELIREFHRNGIQVGSILRGEMFFPCLVDNREAIFVWYDSEQQPTHYRFRKSDKLHPIPPKWFSLFGADDAPKEGDDWF